MNIKKSLIVLIVGFAILASVSASWAKELRIPLTAVEPHLQAKGTAYITGNGLSIHAKGLRPGSVYSVWFVNTKPKMHEIGAGTSPYSFTTDSKGNGVYGSTLSDSPFGDWEMIMIVLHPSGDPTTMDNMQYAFKARIPETR